MVKAARPGANGLARRANAGGAASTATKPCFSKTFRPASQFPSVVRLLM